MPGGTGSAIVHILDNVTQSRADKFTLRFSYHILIVMVSHSVHLHRLVTKTVYLVRIFPVRRMSNQNNH